MSHGATIFTSHSGNQPLVRARTWVTSLLATLLMATGVLVVPATNASAAEPVTITEGTVTWGVRTSFLNYIGTSGVRVSDGLIRNDSGQLVYDITSGSYDPDTHRLELALQGTVQFYAHEGVLDMWLRNLAVVIDGDEPRLEADVTSNDLDGTPHDYGRVNVVDLNLDADSPVIDSGVTTWNSLPSTLSEPMAPAFAGFYLAGSTMDPVKISYTGPGGKPAYNVVNLLSSGAPVYEPDGELVGIDKVTNIVADSPRGIVHIQHIPAGATTPVLQAFDYATLEPLDGPAIAAPQSAYPGMVLYSSTVRASAASTTIDEVPADLAQTTGGTIAAAHGNQVVLYKYDAAIPGYTTVNIDPQVGTVQRITMDTPRSRFLVGGSSGVAVLIPSTSETNGWKAKTYTGAGLNSRSALIATSPTSLVTSSASASASNPLSGLRVITLDPDTDTATATRVRGAADPDSKQPGSFDEPTILMPAGSTRFRASGYSGNFTDVSFVDNTWTASGIWTKAPVRSFVADRVESRNSGTTADVLMLDYSNRLVRVWTGTSWSEISVPQLGSDAWFDRIGADIGLDKSIFVASTTQDNRVLKFKRVGLAASVIVNPASQTTTLDKDDDSADVTFAAEIQEATSFQWQSRLGSSGKFADVAGATSESLTWTATRSDGGRQFRLLATNDFGTVATDVATLTVDFYPQVAVQPVTTSSIEGTDAVFKVMPLGSPYPEVVWQHRVNGTWQTIDTDSDEITIDGDTLTYKSVNLDQDGTQLRARLRNSVGTQDTVQVRLNVTSKPGPVTEPTTFTGVNLEWTGSQEIQKKPPFGGSNYFSAGTSTGNGETYANTAGNVSVTQVSSTGERTLATYETRAQHVTAGGTQNVTVTDGVAVVNPDGSARVAWDGAWSVNFYDGLVPFTITNPVLSVDTSGRGTLTADLSGYSSDMANPNEKTPLEPRKDVVISTFEDVEVIPAGVITIAPQYEGVEVATGDATAQNRTVAGWGAWPQGMVDFHLATGLSSYWYSSGGAADPYKKPTSFDVDFTAATQVPTQPPAAPAISSAPRNVNAIVGAATSLTVNATGDDLTYQWQKRIGSLWFDIPANNSSTLTWDAITIDDAGAYRVRIANGQGEVVSAAAAVTVNKANSALSVTSVKGTYGKRSTVTVNVPGRSGTVTINGVGGKQTATLKAGTVTFTLPATLAAGKHVLTASYSGSSIHGGATATSAVTIAKAKVKKPKVKIKAKPKTTRKGKVAINVLAPAAGLARPTGKVTITVTRGKKVHKVTAKLSNGKRSVKLPKIARGTWKIKAVYAGNANYRKATSATVKVKVTR